MEDVTLALQQLPTVFKKFKPVYTSILVHQYIAQLLARFLQSEKILTNEAKAIVSSADSIAEKLIGSKGGPDSNDATYRAVFRVQLPPVLERVTNFEACLDQDRSAILPVCAGTPPTVLPFWSRKEGGGKSLEERINIGPVHKNLCIFYRDLSGKEGEENQEISSDATIQSDIDTGDEPLTMSDSEREELQNRCNDFILMLNSAYEDYKSRANNEAWEDPTLFSDFTKAARVDLDEEQLVQQVKEFQKKQKEVCNISPSPRRSICTFSTTEVC